MYQAVPDYSFIFNPAVKTNIDRGRPFNGMFIGYPMVIKDSIRDVSPNHQRVQAIVIESGGSKTLLINTYFPTDKKENDVVKEDLGDIIAMIRNLVDNVDCDAAVVTGDINCDTSRQTLHTRTVLHSMEDAELFTLWNKFEIDFTYSSVKKMMSCLYRKLITSLYLMRKVFQRPVSSTMWTTPATMSRFTASSV